MIDAVNLLHARVERLSKEFEDKIRTDFSWVASSEASVNIEIRRELLAVAAELRKQETLSEVV